jgi:hypothetical protein
MKYQSIENTPLAFHAFFRFVLLPINIAYGAYSLIRSILDLHSNYAIYEQYGAGLIGAYYTDIVYGIVFIILAAIVFIGFFRWKPYAWSSLMVILIIAPIYNYYAAYLSGGAYFIRAVILTIFSILVAVYYVHRKPLFFKSGDVSPHTQGDISEIPILGAITDSYGGRYFGMVIQMDARDSYLWKIVDNQFTSKYDSNWQQTGIVAEVKRKYPRTPINNLKHFIQLNGDFCTPADSKWQLMKMASSNTLNRRKAFLAQKVDDGEETASEWILVAPCTDELWDDHTEWEIVLHDVSIGDNPFDVDWPLIEKQAREIECTVFDEDKMQVKFLAINIGTVENQLAQTYFNGISYANASIGRIINTVV